MEYPEAPKLGKYFSIRGGATLPLLLQRGYHTSQLALSASWSFSNGMVANVDKISFEGGKITNFHTIGYTEGVHQLSTGISFSDQVRMSRRDFLPPWAITLSANYVLNPTTDDFGHLVVAYGKLYTPGFAKHHSLSLAASFQTSGANTPRLSLMQRKSSPNHLTASTPSKTMSPHGHRKAPTKC